MILSDGEIWEAILNGELAFSPNVNPEQVTPSSVDLRLGSYFTTFSRPEPGFRVTAQLKQGTNIEQGIGQYSKLEFVPQGKPFSLEPWQFVLAYTLEEVTLSAGLAARVEGRSSIGRVGISIHQTAPTVHATFSGHLRLEVLNCGPFVCEIFPGEPICQLVVERLGRPAQARLQSQFQGQAPGSAPG